MLNKCIAIILVAVIGTSFSCAMGNHDAKKMDLIMRDDADRDGFVCGEDIVYNKKVWLSESNDGISDLLWREDHVVLSSGYLTECNDPNDHPPGESPMSDLDEDGLPDFFEDENLNGKYDRGTTETGLIDWSNFKDADTDDDGLSDAYEHGFGKPSVLALMLDWRFLNPVSPDTDHDGLPDGLEIGLTMPAEGMRDFARYLSKYPEHDTDRAALFAININGLPRQRKCFIIDIDPSTRTDPTNRDTDGDGKIDGLEDLNANGRVDEDESNPLIKD